MYKRQLLAQDALMLIFFIIVMTLLVSMVPWFMHHGLPFSTRNQGRQKFNFYRKKLRSPAPDDIVAPAFDFDIDALDEKRRAGKPYIPPNGNGGEQ